MDQVAPVGRRRPLSSYSDDDGVSQCPQSTVPHPLIFKTSSSYNVFIVMTYATTYFNLIFAQGVANFIVEGTSYDCSANIICLGEACWHSVPSAIYAPLYIQYRSHVHSGAYDRHGPLLPDIIGCWTRRLYTSLGCYRLASLDIRDWHIAIWSLWT